MTDNLFTQEEALELFRFKSKIEAVIEMHYSMGFSSNWVIIQIKEMLK